MVESMSVALGGTFDPIHDGHRALFDKAFSLGDVTVGLTTDAFAHEIRDGTRYVRPYEERKELLSDELHHYAKQYGRSFDIRPLETPTGIATDEQFEHLVVSPETVGPAKRINELREAAGVEPLEIHVVDHVLDEEGEVISSTRVVRGEIDPHGRVLTEADEDT